MLRLKEEEEEEKTSFQYNIEQHGINLCCENEEKEKETQTQHRRRKNNRYKKSDTAKSDTPRFVARCSTFFESP